MPISEGCSPGLCEWVVRMVSEIRSGHDSEWAAMTQVARLLGVGTPESARNRCRRAEVDAGRRPGATSEKSTELKRLQRANAELKRANVISQSASAFFASELDRPQR